MGSAVCKRPCHRTSTSNGGLFRVHKTIIMVMTATTTIISTVITTLITTTINWILGIHCSDTPRSDGEQ